MAWADCKWQATPDKGQVTGYIFSRGGGLAFGLGVGFSVISPWSDQGVSSTTFTVAAGIYLLVVAMLSNTIGGYLAGRLRTQWHSVNEHERYFRDSAHGFLVWAFATRCSFIATVFGAAICSERS